MKRLGFHAFRDNKIASNNSIRMNLGQIQFKVETKMVLSTNFSAETYHVNQINMIKIKMTK